MNEYIRENCLLPKSTKSRQSSFKARQIAAGLVRVEVWIPKDRKADVLAYVESVKK